MHESNFDQSPHPLLDTTLVLLLKAFDLAVDELAELKGISYGDQRRQLLLQATVSQQP